MPSFGAHAFLWIADWNVEAGNRAIRAAGAAGFDFIEIPLLRPQEFDAKAHKQALADAGLTATGSLVLPNGAHMPDQPQKAKDFLVRALDALAGVGGTYLCGCIAYNLGYLTGSPPTARERQVVIETLVDVAAEAKKRGMTIGLECCNRYETYLYNTLADGRETVLAVRELGADNIELHGDTYHMNIEEEGYYKPIVAAADVLGYMHMSESHRGLVGSGTVNWDEVFRGLKDANFTGPLVLESFAAINPDLQAATKLWRPPNQPSDVLAGEGLKVLRDGAAKAGLL
ncbi:MAG: sugar phosphate isomerase/epimerase [Anaerolineae bacterium]|nr:sugar phosphate isomerase/epimerase [Anaerolineae bacterium]